jgi:hypothetical protein
MLSMKRTRLDAACIAELCAIKVIPKGLPEGRSKRNPVRQIGKSTLIVNVRELKTNPSERLQKRIDRRNQELKDCLGTDENFGWIRWDKNPASDGSAARATLSSGYSIGGTGSAPS